MTQKNVVGTSGRRTAWGSRWGGLVLLLGSLLVTALIFEGLVLLVFGEQAKFPRHVVGAPFGVRINEPGATYRHKSADVTVWFKINSQGMRADRDYAYAKPPGTKRIVLLGDSYSVGYEVPFEASYGSVLERELRRRGISVEVLNAAVSGFGNAEEAVYLERELLKYQPDLVAVGFYGNDLLDNVRSNLFRLDGETIVEADRSYIPGGRLANFLNTNVVFNWLSERSNAFVILKERATEALKRRVVKDNIEALDSAEAGAAAKEAERSYERRLAAALFEKLYTLASSNGGSLAVVSIPTYRQKPDRLIDTFPVDLFGGSRPSYVYVSGAAVLEPHLGREPLYWLRSHYHWTPFAHDVVGRTLADRVVSAGLLH